MAKTYRIVDIARQLSLSNTAVGEILRGKKGYNELTRRMVLDKAKELGYRPNYLSKALSGGKSMTIGLLAGMSETPIYADMVRSIEISLRRFDYLCYILELSYDDKNTVKNIRSLIDRRVDGLIIFADPIMYRSDLNNVLNDSPSPVVRIGQGIDPSHHAVHVRREKALNQMAQHLSELGHKEAAYVTTEYTFESTDTKLNHYRKAFQAANIKLDISQRWMVPPGEEYNYGCLKLVQHQIKKGDLPTALVLNCDRFAFEAITALTDAGVKVPQDVSVIGFDDDYFAGIIRPRLTTICQPLVKAGKIASEMLLKLMNEPEASIPNQTLDCGLIIRDSTGPAKTS